MEKLKMHSADLTEGHIDKIAEFFPSVITETLSVDGNPVRSVDFDALRQELSDHIVEGPQERYQLDWPGKRAAAFAANAPIAKTLRPVREESVDFDTTKNLVIKGDNLEALKLLQESYLGRIKLIYIDPPYNTGRDFVYADDFTESRDDYLRRSGQATDLGKRLVSNPDSSGRFHSDWLSMMYPRLKLARNLLRDDGVICVSIDDNEVANLVKLCEEVFGAHNHLATFVWKSKSGGANDSGEVAVDHEYVVCFSRTNCGNVFGLDPGAVATTSYNNEDERGRYALERLDKQNLQYSASLDYDLVGPDGSIYYLEHKDPTRPNAVWRWAKERVEREIDHLVFKGGHVYTKNYEKAGGKPRSLLVDERFGRTRTGSTEVRELLGGSYFDNPKPTRLLSAIAAIATADDSVVLDFFAGSGSLGHAIMDLNAKDGGSRRFILVQLPEPIPHASDVRDDGFESLCDVLRKRLEIAGSNIRSSLVGKQTDVGFRTLKVDSTNLANVLHPPMSTAQATLSAFEESIKPGRTGEDLVFQVMVEWGLDLSLPIKTEMMAGCPVFDVGDGALMASFNSAITMDLVRALTSRQPLRVIFRDSDFESDATRINAEQVLKELSPATELRSF